nr:proline-rich receptor-like protein kinase PERK2 [Penaeus vannamei]
MAPDGPRWLPNTTNRGPLRSVRVPCGVTQTREATERAPANSHRPRHLRVTAPSHDTTFVDRGLSGATLKYSIATFYKNSLPGSEPHPALPPPRWRPLTPSRRPSPACAPASPLPPDTILDPLHLAPRLTSPREQAAPLALPTDGFVAPAPPGPMPRGTLAPCSFSPAPPHTSSFPWEPQPGRATRAPAGFGCASSKHFAQGILGGLFLRGSTQRSGRRRPPA